MIFTSFTTVIISVTAMAGVAIASDNLNVSPLGLPCFYPSKHFCGLRADLFVSISANTIHKNIPEAWRSRILVPGTDGKGGNNVG
ncbi:uncharacterized protein F5147DRAFT_678279 [Suillus discolor]|uniref:Secreted protein n=1 Tax=Suillus discolor TaxID=1912936 RepID=A0A9P7JXE1_9AGAM|nr:uncharacterized protein F5147DRAFT_678279 [Suillus discolor]KAG2114179.1 hypothetical protein F5147DRAFT_678279 [Suillus discolor]